MRVYISVDMEGVAGIVHVDQTRRTGSDYQIGRRLMTAEAQAAALGAYDAGATRVLVNDSHGDMRNFLLDELDPRVEILSGDLKPRSMVQGIEERFDVALFVGYHAGAGSIAGILDHTYYGRVVTEVRVNGRIFNETAINALVCGTYGTPVALVTGDETTCAQAREILPEVETVAVKAAVTRYAARSLHPVAARARIREAAARACGRAAALQPFRIAPPLRLEMDCVTSAMADAAELVPATDRVAGVGVRYTAPDPETLLRVLQAWTILAASTIPA